MPTRFPIARLVLCSSLLLGFPAESLASAITFSVGGNNTTASIQATVDNFRAAIGGANNNNGGSTTGGRREINWDGGGLTTPTATGTPLTAFLNNRGALMTTPGTGFLQAQAGDLGNASYAGEFLPFSPTRLFTAVGSNITDVTFFLPGSNGGTQAFVSAFGSVFSDVDLGTSTRLDFFDQNNALLTSVFAPAGTTANQSLSFIGVLFNAGELIGRVRITSGTAALGGLETPGTDLVAMDDFVFAEPTAVPEPMTLALVGAGLVAARAARRRT
jgi:hypothetical protein